MGASKKEEGKGPPPKNFKFQRRQQNAKKLSYFLIFLIMIIRVVRVFEFVTVSFSFC
jgi:uncharacterized membrane protein